MDLADHHLSTSAGDASLRLVICWPGVNGYLAACWRALAGRSGVDLKIVVFPHGNGPNAPFDTRLVQGLNCDILSPEDWNNTGRIAGCVAAHQPQAVIICGWNSAGMRGLPAHPSLAAARFAVAIDTPWKNTWRQRLGRFKVGRYLDRMTRAFVAGERSFQLARQLKIPENRIRRGMYGVDYSRFQPLHSERLNAAGGWPRQFLFAGRLEPMKGVDTLMDGYTAYRASRPDAWPLICCGSGPLAELVQRTPGVEHRGFLQPDELLAAWRAAGVFVLPSRYDPWPLAIVEACAAGLPVICTEACGSSVENVRPFYNGRVVSTGNSSELAAALGWMHDHADRLPEMGACGQPLAAAYSAQVWAERWHSVGLELRDAAAASISVSRH